MLEWRDQLGKVDFEQAVAAFAKVRSEDPSVALMVVAAQSGSRPIRRNPLSFLPNLSLFGRSPAMILA